MATHACSIRTPLLPPPSAAPPLLPRGAGRGLGPVTRALRAIQSGIPETERERVRALRRCIADRIEADIALLDALSGDPDLEPNLGAPIDPAHWRSTSSQKDWACGVIDDREEDAGDQGEQENEHGGDIQDEPHDEEEDDDRCAGPGDPPSALRPTFWHDLNGGIA